MTREEFQENVNSWYDLREFCNEYGCEVCSDIYSQDEMDEEIDNSIVDMAREATDWKDLLSKLEDIPTEDDYYLKNGYGDFTELDDEDFDCHKDDVFDWAENEGIFDEEDEEDEESEEDIEEPDEREDPDDGYEVGNEEMSIAELFVVPNNGTRGIYNV